MANTISQIDSIIQRSRAASMTYTPGAVVPQYMLLYDEDTKIVRQGNGTDVFEDLPIWLDLSAIDDVNTYVNAMFTILSLSMSGSFLVVNDAGNAFEVTADKLTDFVNGTVFDAAAETLADSDHTHELSQVNGLGSVSEYIVGSTDGTIPIIGGTGLLNSSLFNPNTVLSPFDSDVISYLLLARTASDMGSLMNLENSIADEFMDLLGISQEDSFGYTYTDDHFEFTSIVAKDAWGQQADATDPGVRYYHGMATVKNKVYVYGGIDGDTNYLNDTWEYNLDTDTWVQKANGPGARFLHTMVTVGDKIYVFGGSPLSGSYYDELHVYDPSTNEWTELTTSPLARYASAMCVIDTDIFMYGGYNGAYQNDFWKYNTVDDEWTLLTAGPYGCYGHFLEAVGTTVVLGGGYDGSGAVNTTYSYDTTQVSTWIAKANIPITIRGCGSIVNNDVVYIFGGYNGETSQLASIYSYDLYNDEWDDSLTANGTAVKYHAVSNMEGHLVSYGGNDGSSYINEVHVYGADPIKKVQSKDYYAPEDPTDAHMFIRGAIGDGATLNTDIVVSVTRSGDENWRPVKLTELPMVDSSIKCYSGDATFQYMENTSLLNWADGTLEDLSGTLDTFTVDTANTSGHFEEAINDKIEAGCIIKVPSGNVVITNITGDGTADDSVEFIGTLGVQDHSIDNINGLLIEDNKVKLNAVTTKQTALIAINDIWMDVISMVGLQTTNGSTINYAFGYADNTFDIVLDDTSRRTIVRYYLGVWEYWTDVDTYTAAPINSSTSAISEYFEVNGGTEMTVDDILTAEPVPSGKQLSLISVTVSGGDPEIDSLTINGIINAGAEAPAGRVINWKVESNCADTFRLDAVRLQYR